MRRRCAAIFTMYGDASARLARVAEPRKRSSRSRPAGSSHRRTQINSPREHRKTATEKHRKTQQEKLVERGKKTLPSFLLCSSVFICVHLWLFLSVFFSGSV